MKVSLRARRNERQGLTFEERKTLSCHFRHSSDLKAVFRLQNRLEEQLSLRAAGINIRKWIIAVALSRERYIDKFIDTLARCWNEILKFFVEHETSGFVESLNNKLHTPKHGNSQGPVHLQIVNAFILCHNQSNPFLNGGTHE